MIDATIRTAWTDLDPQELRALAAKHTRIAAYGYALAHFRERDEGLDRIIASALSPGEAAALEDEKARRVREGLPS